MRLLCTTGLVWFAHSVGAKTLLWACHQGRRQESLLQTVKSSHQWRQAEKDRLIRPHGRSFGVSRVLSNRPTGHPTGRIPSPTTTCALGAAGDGNCWPDARSAFPS